MRLDGHITIREKSVWDNFATRPFKALKHSQHLQCHHWFPHEMMSEEQVQKFHTDDVSLPRSG